MHMSVDRYYCYVYQNAENEDMIYGNDGFPYPYFITVFIYALY